MVLLASEGAPQVLDLTREVLVGAELPAVQAVPVRASLLAQHNPLPTAQRASPRDFRAAGAMTRVVTRAARKLFARPRPHSGA